MDTSTHPILLKPNRESGRSLDSTEFPFGRECQRFDQRHGRLDDKVEHRGRDCLNPPATLFASAGFPRACPPTNDAACIEKRDIRSVVWIVLRLPRTSQSIHPIIPMKKKSTSQSAFFNLRVLIGLFIAFRRRFSGAPRLWRVLERVRPGKGRSNNPSARPRTLPGSTDTGRVAHGRSCPLEPGLCETCLTLPPNRRN